MGVDQIINKSAEFGLLAFLLVLTWVGLGVSMFWVLKAGWQFANKQADKSDAARLAQVAAMERIADSSRIIATMTEVSGKQQEQIAATLATIEKQNHRLTRVARMTIEVIRETLPADKPRAIQLLEQAKMQLEE